MPDEPSEAKGRGGHRGVSSAGESGLSAPDCPIGRRILIYTGSWTTSSTVEAVEAIADAYPNWQLLVLQDSARPVPIVSYLRRKLRRLRREPLSYPLELLSEALSRLRFPASAGHSSPVRLPGFSDLGRANVSHRVAGFRDGSAEAAARDFAPWLGISLAAPILRKVLFSLPELGTINVHKSYLPEYRGMPPGFWELHDGADVTGVSIHWIVAELDKGPIVDQVAYSIPHYADPESIGPQLDELSIPLLLSVLRRLDGGERTATPQGVSRTPTRSRPPFLQYRRLRRRLGRRRSQSHQGAARLRHCFRNVVLWLYVHAYARIRNLIRHVRGTAHVVILLYHRVDDNYLDDVTVGVAQFGKQLSEMKRNYDVLDMNQFLSSRGRRRRRVSVVITFDDGYASAHLAARLLRRQGIPATLFVSTGFVESDKAFPHDMRKLEKAVPPLSWDQIREMAQWGIHIAPHTVDHADVGSLPLEDAIGEIAGARRDLIDRLGQTGSECWFAYPHGKEGGIPDAVRSAMPGLGVTHCFSAYGGVNKPDFDLKDIKRQGVDWKYSTLALRAVIEGWKVRGR